MAKKIGVLGSGEVGEALADGFLKHGHAVMRGSREPQKLAEWKSGAGAQAQVGTFAEAAKFGEIVVLAVKGSAALAAAEMAGAAIDGKVVIDTTNPIADAPPVAGVIVWALGPNESLLEKLQE